jgi:hypothetical protein
LAIGYWLLAIGYWLLAIGYWLLAIGYWLLAIGYWLLAIGYWLRAPSEAASMETLQDLYLSAYIIAIIVAITKMAHFSWSLTTF